MQKSTEPRVGRVPGHPCKYCKQTAANKIYSSNVKKSKNSFSVGKKIREINLQHSERIDFMVLLHSVEISGFFCHSDFT